MRGQRSLSVHLRESTLVPDGGSPLDRVESVPIE